MTKLPTTPEGQTACANLLEQVILLVDSLAKHKFRQEVASLSRTPIPHPYPPYPPLSLSTLSLPPLSLSPTPLSLVGWFVTPRLPPSVSPVSYTQVSKKLRTTRQEAVARFTKSLEKLEEAPTQQDLAQKRKAERERAEKERVAKLSAEEQRKHVEKERKALGRRNDPSPSPRNPVPLPSFATADYVSLDMIGVFGWVDADFFRGAEG